MGETDARIAAVRQQWQRDFGFTASDEFIAKHLTYTDILSRPRQIKAVGLFGDNTWLDISERVSDFSRIAEKRDRDDYLPAEGTMNRATSVRLFTIIYTHDRQDSDMPQTIVMFLGASVLQARVNGIAEREIAGNTARSVLILAGAGV